MNKLFLRLLVAFVAFSFALVLTSVVKPVHRSQRAVPVVTYIPEPLDALAEDEAQIRVIYREYGPAQTRHDRAFFERIETEDFTLTVGNLKLSREEDIQWMLEQSTDKIFWNRVDHIKVFDRL